MKNWIFFFGLALLLLAGCQKDSTLLGDLTAFDETPGQMTQTPALVEKLPNLYQPTQEVHLGVPFTLQMNGSAIILPDRITITLNSMTEDSRCPVGLQCIWEGRAVAQFSFEKYDVYQTAQLATPSNVPKPSSEITIFNRRVKLLGVSPYPVAESTIPAGKYRVTLVVDRGVAGDTF